MIVAPFLLTNPTETLRLIFLFRGVHYAGEAESPS